MSVSRSRIVECVPNFSEGRRQEVIEAIADVVRKSPGTALLNTQWDTDHNRCVITFAGEPEAVAEAAFAACRRAAELIDLRRHQGSHPRIGATDVIPLVPIRSTTVEECVAIARQLAERIARELSIPTYVYGQAALRPENRDLSRIRRGNFEGLREAVRTDPERRPDFGPPELHPSAGATVVGVRPPLVAFNVELGTSDLEFAKEVAKRVRESSGGLVNVKAMGVLLEGRGITQVSMNMTDYTRTPLYRAFELVRAEAARHGVPVIGSEIVGLVPTDALLDCAEYYLGLRNWTRNQLLERRLAEALEEEEQQGPQAGGPGGREGGGR